MKTKLIAIALFASTAAVVASHPIERGTTTPGRVDPVRVDPIGVDPVSTDALGVAVAARQRIDVVFALDTTGSMGGLIAAAKEKIWSIASTMASAINAPEIRVGLVAYRDRGDAYVTRVVDLSSDLDSVYATLMDFHAGGGGDGPESVNKALHDAVHEMSWSQDESTYKVVFLVGDAPPHMDYQDEVAYPETLRVAASRGIVVNAIQCGNNGATTARWEQIAALGSGRYFQVGQSGSAVAVATPFDEKLAALSAKLDETRLYYGNEEEKAKTREKVEASDKLRALASAAAQARRAIFNTTRSGEANLLGDSELVGAVASGRVELEEIDEDALPEVLKPMSPAERKTVVKDTAKRRDALKQEIQAISRQRAEYIAKEVDAAGGAAASLDDRIYETVREQAASKGLRYDAPAPRY